MISESYPERNTIIMKKLIFIFLFAWATPSLIAQVTIQPRQADNTNKGIIYLKELAFDFRLNTVRGFSMAVNWGKIVSYHKTTYFQVELGSLRHPKEYKQNDQFSRRFGGQRSFIYGKQNSFFALRGGWGQKHYLSEKAARKGVAIGVTYEVGPSIGITKPYYLELIKAIDSPIVQERFTPENREFFTDINRIQGAAPFIKGITEIGIIPGGQFKAALHFDWGAYDEYVKAMEIGIMGDFYFKNVPILIDDSFEGASNRPFFLNLYVAMQLGKRW